jgi:hypothetical protein
MVPDFQLERGCLTNDFADMKETRAGFEKAALVGFMDLRTIKDKL